MKKAGFTLIEILLSIVIITILSVISIPIYQSFQNKNSLDITTQTIVQILRQAQTFASSNYRDSDWGVYIENQLGTIILFKGESYLERDQGFDETTSIPVDITFNPTSNEIVFSKSTGFPQSQQQIELNFNNSTTTITINEKGIINY